MHVAAEQSSYLYWIKNRSMLIFLEQLRQNLLQYPVYWSWWSEAARTIVNRVMWIVLPFLKQGLFMGKDIIYLLFCVSFRKSLLYVSCNWKEDLLHIEVCLCTLLREFKECQSYPKSYWGFEFKKDKSSDSPSQKIWYHIHQLMPDLLM